jgi:lysyl oxidase
LRQSNKKGFCLIDVDFEAWGEKGNGPRKHSFPGCQLPNYHDEEGDWVEQGIDAGWADVYNWFLADQFIDITGLPDGVYRLEVIADPNDTLLESDETDNARSTWICIAGMDVDKVSGPTAGCPVDSY